MALTMARARAALDVALEDVTHIEWSENGSTVSSNVAATAVSLEDAVDLTTYARKGLNVTSPPLLSAAAAGACTITHARMTDAGTGGTPQTGWVELTDPIDLEAGGQIRVNDAGIGEKWTLGA